MVEPKKYVKRGPVALHCVTEIDRLYQLTAAVGQ